MFTPEGVSPKHLSDHGLVFSKQLGVKGFWGRVAREDDGGRHGVVGPFGLAARRRGRQRMHLGGSFVVLGLLFFCIGVALDWDERGDGRCFHASIVWKGF